jgi:hypothetical protein
MTEGYATLFKLFDEYAKLRYDCFLAEFFLNDATHEYVLCFRPTGATREDPRRYACRYLRVKVPEMLSILGAQALTPTITDTLNNELASLKTQLN